MRKTSILVSTKRNYLVTTVADAKSIVTGWLTKVDLAKATSLGLPEVDDRYHYWRIPLKNSHTNERIGEIVINAYTTEIVDSKSTKLDILEKRLLGKKGTNHQSEQKIKRIYTLSQIRNTVGFGDSAKLIEDMPTNSIDLIFTSPPYFNARPEYSEYSEYDEYLFKMRQVIKRCHRVLADGRFFAINCSPVLLRRSNRNESSKRIAVPFDLHRIFIEEGYDFIDDIIWLKPEGAGWATSRGRRFAADRNPLQYKAVPVTEYILVYRKRSDLLIDWFIRNYPDKDILRSSRINDDYERTNVWKINPRINSDHPAAFPVELAEKVIKYYSFKGDVVMDPFAGSGTVGAAAVKSGRRFVLFEINREYIDLIRCDSQKWLGKGAEQILWINTPVLKPVQQLF